ncbi:polysulfide reductase NrfD [Malaciobacter molluscorum]|uniref:NrfD/PsrC family molybdoenzyme membrane anchor subunit n=1 Tax=Malaciobacter molluscorum TaxID=1032072 RepID=UPI00100AC78C|nr:NrfD/PsrC family molybdoenzyme membrane anchor subunit [Malaciobacter molluscorum]RXJ97404.1 polysulfide reductase NrfD [Malaciobacter molluscorum]
MDTIITTLASITPNRAWGIDVPIYFWFSGASIACFLLFCLYYVFKIKSLKDISSLMIIVSFCLFATALMNLVDDLHQPGRMFNFFLYGWENFLVSPMKWGALLLISYTVMILIIMQKLFRSYFAKKARENENSIKSFFYAILTLGNFSVTQEEKQKDEKLIRILSILSLPLAIATHGYTGYEVAVVQGNQLWNTPLMPILFLVTAMVSGIGILLIIVPLFEKIIHNSQKTTKQVLPTLNKFIGITQILNLSILLLWLTFMIVFDDEKKHLLSVLFNNYIGTWIHVLILSAIIVNIFVGFSKYKSSTFLSIISALLAISSAWIFRFTIVISGQAIPKMVPGFLTHSITSAEMTSIFSSIALFIALLTFMSALFPITNQLRQSK